MDSDPDDEERAAVITNFGGVRAMFLVPHEDLELFSETFESFGVEFRAVSPQQPDKHLEDGYCYWNARRLAESRPDQLLYVDGFAGRSVGDQVGPDTNTYPTYEIEHHAWCINRVAQVVDPTWNPSDKVYWGIPIPWQYVKSLLDRKNEGGDGNHQSYLTDWTGLSEGERDELYREFRIWAGLEGNAVCS